MTKDRILDGQWYSVEPLKLATSQRSTHQNRAAVEITAGRAGLGGPQQPRQYFKIIKTKKKIWRKYPSSLSNIALVAFYSFYLEAVSLTLTVLTYQKIYICVWDKVKEGGGGSVCRTKREKKITLTISLFCFFLHKYCCKYIKKISILSGKHHFCPSINFWIKKCLKNFYGSPHPPFLFLFLFHKNISWHFFFFLQRLLEIILLLYLET